MCYWSESDTSAMGVDRETESGTVERYRYKWHSPVTDVTVVDEPLGFSQTPRGGPGKTAVAPMKSGGGWNSA